MTMLLNYVEAGQIEGINRAVLDRAYDVLANPNDARRERLRVCLTQLALHLLEDPDRIRNAEFQGLARDVQVIVGGYDNINRNHQVLAGGNGEIDARIRALGEQITALTNQLAAERARLRVYEFDFAKKKAQQLDSLHTKNAVLYISVLPISMFFVSGLSKEQQELSARAKKWHRVASLIQNKKLMLEDAKKQVGVR